MTRRSWVDLEGGLPVVRQCVLSGVSRAAVYVCRHPEEADEADLRLCRLIDEEYTRRPFYGSRRMVVFLKTAGYGVNRKRVQRLMRQMGLAGMAPGPNTSRPHLEHRIHPYLLRGVAVIRPNQVWSTDIPTFAWREVLSIWSRSSTGIAERC
jgi:putative transposase